METAPHDELDLWEYLPISMEQTARDIARPTRTVKVATASTYTSVPLGIWYSPITQKYAMDVPDDATAGDIQLVKQAVELAGELADELPSYEDGYIKVAQSPQITPVAPTSPGLRQVGEYLQYLPQRYSNDVIPGYGPVNGMLAGGLVGAGLGYGAGWLGEKILPEKWERGRLRKTLGVLGGLAGATPGAIFAGANMMGGKAPWDSGMFDDSTKLYNNDGTKISEDQFSGNFKMACELGPRLLWEARQEAFESAFDMEGVKLAEEKIAGLAINVDELGRTLWETGADPQTAATTMSTLHAAQYMPGGENQAGFVTPLQMAQLGAQMGAGYVSGALVGSALGILTGMPEGPKQRLKQTGMYLGVVRSVVPKLFG